MDTKEKRRQPVRRKRTAPIENMRCKPQAKPSPDVVYTQPGPFNRDRFILRLITVVAVVLALVFGMSIFFKVDEQKILISGTEKYSAWQVREASGIRDGENLLTLNKAKIGAKIQAALPYVDQVRIGIKLPDTVNIEIVELAVVYAIQANDDSWWLMRADGGIVERTDAATAGEHTKLTGVKITGATVGQKAVAYEPPEAEPAPDGTPAPAQPLAKDKLNALVDVLQYVEACGVIGGVGGVDVSDLTQLNFWYSDRIHVQLGDTTNLKYKIENAVAAIYDDKLTEHSRGTLDASYTTWPDKVGFIPFED